jgi:6-pyruvoyltetrahydropterin/6-carboxytetrahydropterin synthase
MAIVELSRSITFQAAHDLPMMPDGHKCRGKHGHSYTARLWIKGDVGADGIVIDNAEIDHVLKAVHALLDHKDLNACEAKTGIASEEVFYRNPTAEHMAVFIYELARGRPGIEPFLDRVEVYEGPDSIFLYRGE